jgi:hypothetical protein
MTEPEPNKIDNMDSKDKLQLICWLIERNYERRGAIANRAAMVIGADALLLAGITFLLDRVLLNQGQYSGAELVLLSLSIACAIILLTLSIVYAAVGVSSAWITQSAKTRLDEGGRLFFHPYETVDSFKDIAELMSQFKNTSYAQMITYALGYLWSNEKLFCYRYVRLRRAIQLLIFAIIPFLVACAVLLVKLTW